MLPSLGFQEILLLGVLALVVVGPKDLPLLLRKLGRWTAKLRGMAQEFRTGFDELARQAELDELKREVEALRKTTSLTEISREMQKPLPTLEDYAGLPKSSEPPPPASNEGAGAALEVVKPAPPEAASDSAPAGPQPSVGDDMSSTKEARSVPERARSAP